MAQNNVINAVVAVELFLIFRSLWVLLAALAICLVPWRNSCQNPRRKLI